MDDAEVTVEVQNETENKIEQKPKKVYRSFKSIIIEKITKRAKNLPDYIIDPIIDEIAASLDNLQNAIEKAKSDNKSQKAVQRKLSKFSKEEIENYLKNLN